MRYCFPRHCLTYRSKDALPCSPTRVLGRVYNRFAHWESSWFPFPVLVARYVLTVFDAMRQRASHNAAFHNINPPFNLGSAIHGNSQNSHGNIGVDGAFTRIGFSTTARRSGTPAICTTAVRVFLKISFEFCEHYSFVYTIFLLYGSM